MLIYLPVSGMICILSLVYRKKKVPEHPTWKVVYSETMVKNHDYYIRLHTGPQGGYWCFLLRAVRTPIYALSVRECSVTGIPVPASAKRRWFNGLLKVHVIKLRQNKNLLVQQDYTDNTLIRKLLMKVWMAAIFAYQQPESKHKAGGIKPWAKSKKWWAQH